MIGRILVAATLIFMCSCASSDPKTLTSAETASSASVDAVATNNPSTPSASVDAVATNNPSTPSASDPQDLDAPSIPQAESVALENDPDEIICRKVQETGSRFKTKVCSTRGEMAARAAADQEIMDEFRTIRSGGSCALNGNC